MKIATWNVNGVRAREAQLLEGVGREQPDVVCLQELKATREQVPASLVGLGDYWSMTLPEGIRWVLVENERSYGKSANQDGVRAFVGEGILMVRVRTPQGLEIGLIENPNDPT